MLKKLTSAYILYELLMATFVMISYGLFLLLPLMTGFIFAICTVIIVLLSAITFYKNYYLEELF